MNINTTTVWAMAYVHKFTQAPCFIYSFIFAEGGGIFFEGISSGLLPTAGWITPLLDHSFIAVLDSISATFGPNGILSSAQAMPAPLEALTLSLGWHCRCNMLIRCCCCLRCHLNCWCNWYSCEVFQPGCEWNPDEHFLCNRHKGHAFFMYPCLRGCHRLPLCRGVCGKKERLLMRETVLAGSSVFTRTCPARANPTTAAKASARHSNWHSSHLCSRNKEVKCRWDSDQL